MKLHCPCGESISDTTDFLPNKAALFADQDHEDIRNALARGADPWPVLRRHTIAAVYQCPECHRLAILRGADVHWFVPEADAPALLHSSLGARWRRPLIGHWRDGKGELSWDDSTAPDDGDGRFLTEFGSWEELRQLYRQTFERLLAADRLRSALLTRDGKTVDRWPPAANAT